MRTVTGHLCAKFFALVFILQLFISACGQSTGATDRLTAGGLDTANSGNSTGSQFNPADSLGDMASALDAVPAETPAQQTALDAGSASLNDLSGLYNLLGDVDTQAEAKAWQDRLKVAEAELLRVSQALEAAGLAQLAAALREILAKHDIYRVFNKKGQHHIFTDLVEGIILVSQGGWTFEGVSLRMYDAGANGRAAIYRCLVPKSGDHFASRDSKCEGQTTEGILGYAMTAKSNGAYLPLTRFVYTNGVASHILTMDPGELAFLRSHRAVLKEEGVIGYMNW